MKIVPAAYTVSSLTMEVEEVIHTFSGLPQKVTVRVKNGMRSPDWKVLMVDIHLLKLLWVYCPACRSEGKRPSRQTDGQSNPNKWLASRKI